MQKDSESDYVPALSYRWLTPYYDVVVGATTRERVFKLALVQQASITAGQQILDLACGTGTLAIRIKQEHPFATVTGVDGDPEILSIATRKAQSANVTVQFDHALSYALPYRAAYFDRVVSSLFFHHLTWQDKERTAHELFRVLKPGGEIHVADWGHPANALMRALFVSIQMLDGITTTRDNVRGRLVGLFRETGFAEVAERQTFSTMFGTMALYSGVKLIR